MAAASSHAQNKVHLSSASGPDWIHDAELEKHLTDAATAADAPGAIGGILHVNKPMRLAAYGVRKLGSEALAQLGDLVHIGSCTKAMTAVLIARLVQGGQLQWHSTVGEVLVKIAGDIHPQFRGVTLAQLLQHTAGVAPNAANWWSYARKPLRDRRLSIARDGMKAKPLAAPGTAHVYSNLSVMIAGAMAEQACGEDWESLMQQHVFGPLSMNSAGFGAPGSKHTVDQPWGHAVDASGTLTPAHADNAAALGPAGTVHLTLPDWGRFVSVFLELEDSSDYSAGGKTECQGDPFLSRESKRMLLAPGGADGAYAMGWILAERKWACGQALTHSGSNTMWFASVWVAPKIGAAYLVAFNAYSEQVKHAANAFISATVVQDRDLR